MLSTVDIKYFKMATGGPFRESDVDIAVKCPICGDSKYKKSSKRLHLYTKDGNLTFVNCFNGGCAIDNKTMYNFLKEFYPDLFEMYKKETFNFKIQEYKKDFEDIHKNKINDINLSVDDFKIHHEPIINYIPFNNISFGEIKESTKAYLLSRGINYEKASKIFGEFYTPSDNFIINGKYLKVKDFLLIPFRYQNKIYGFYSRSVTDKTFVNFTMEPNYTLWNYFNIDKTKRVFIFEAIIDALSFYEMTGETNIIALNTSKINDDRLNELDMPYFCLDNDTVGIESMIKYTDIKKCNFLIYNNCPYKDMNDIYLNNYKLKFEFKSGFAAKISLKQELGS